MKSGIVGRCKVCRSTLTMNILLSRVKTQCIFSPVWVLWL